MKNSLVKVGNIGIDAGICWIGDPCYILHQDELPDAVGKSWNEFCDIVGGKEHVAIDDGLGVCVSTGYGDGEYPVFAEIKDGRVMRVIIDFAGDPDDEG